MATIVIKNSSTASAVPTSGDLVQGELAVNVTDKKLYTEDSGGTVVKLVGSLGNQESNNVAITGGAVNGTTVGATTASTGAFTTLTSNSTTTLNGTTIPASKTLVVTTDIGSTVQGYDADTAKTDVAQTFTISQRGTVTTDNDGSFSMSATNNFKCTPTGNFTLTFTNITAGQSGFILLVNSGGYTVSAAATTKVSTTALATISAAGTYLLSYFTDGTNVYVVNSGALA
jgi:hypothetical protein